MNGDVIEPAKFKRVLLTGGGGFVGGYLSPLLAQAYPQAERVLLRRPGSTEERAGYDCVEAEVYDFDAINDIVARLRPDLVVHLAAQASVGESQRDAAGTWQVNCAGTLALASACARFAPEVTFFFVSSGQVYGATLLGGPVREDAPLRPVGAYARSKAAAEQVLEDVLPSTARLVALRPFNHTGPGQDERFPLPSFAAQIARIEKGLQPPEIRVGNLSAKRDYLDVRDVGDAYIRLIQGSTSLPMRSVFNVCSGAAHSLGELLTKMRGLSPADVAVIVDPERLRPIDVPEAVGVNERLVSTLNWTPQRRFEDTLADLLDWARRGAQ